MGMGTEFWLPALIGAGSTAASNALFGGVEDPQTLASFAQQPGDFLDPRLQLEQNMRDRAQLQAIMAQRAAGPVDIPGAFVQPVGVRAGGGLPGPIGVTAQDPALFNPQQFLYRPGARFAQPDFTEHDRPGQQDFADWTGEYQPYIPEIGDGQFNIGAGRSAAPLSSKRWFGGEYAPRYTPPPPLTAAMPTDPRPVAERFRGLEQPGLPGTPMVGGGIPQLMANLELLGVAEDETGVLRMDPDVGGAVANPDLFQGRFPVNPRGGVPASEVEGAPQPFPSPPSAPPAPPIDLPPNGNGDTGGTIPPIPPYTKPPPVDPPFDPGRGHQPHPLLGQYSGEGTRNVQRRRLRRTET